MVSGNDYRPARRRRWRAVRSRPLGQFSGRKAKRAMAVPDGRALQEIKRTVRPQRLRAVRSRPDRSVS